MREERAFWIDLRDILQGFVETEVSRVRLDANAIQNQNVQVLKSGNCFVGNKIQIRRVSKIVESVSDDRKLSVDDFEGSNFEILTDTKRSPWNDRVRDQLGQTAAEMRRVKNILKDSTKIYPRDLVRVNTHRPVTKIERPNVVETEDMIDVAVRDQDRVQSLDLRTQRLLSKINRCVDKDLFITVFDKDGDAKAFVTGILR